MKPINSNVLIKIQIPDYKTTDSGIILGAIKSVVNDRETTGIVEAVGPEVKTLKPGYKVFFDVVSGIDYEEQGNHYVIIRERDILGYINDSSTY